MPKIKRAKLGPGAVANSTTTTTSYYRNADIEFVSGDVSGVPFCEHGPTLLLARLKRGEIEKFYACAVCRSRKDCNYYRSYEEELRHPTSEQKRSATKKIMKRNRGLSHKELYTRLKRFRKSPPERRRFCAECSRLLLNVEEAKKHDENVDGKPHQVINGISDKQLRRPSRLLKLSENAKKEAQFIFSRSTLSLFGREIIEKFQFDGVLCIGTPSIKEFLHTSPYRSACKSFLLDVDYRYAQFWSPRFYAQFNMFNGYFYTSVGEHCFRRFLEGVKKLLIVIDPPFGGLIAPLARTILGLKSDFEKTGDGGRSCDIVLVSPYYMEQKISGAFPGMVMLDYMVTYDESNHVPIGGNGLSHVRLFTSLPAGDIRLPPELGYRYCEHCKRYVASENRHCQLCRSCTSKDGHPYSHCDKCGTCVKGRYDHCKKCDRCHKKNGDDCRSSSSSTSCGLCGEQGHAWVKCPKMKLADSDGVEEEEQPKNGHSTTSVVK